MKVYDVTNEVWEKDLVMRKSKLGVCVKFISFPIKVPPQEEKRKKNSRRLWNVLF